MSRLSDVCLCGLLAVLASACHDDDDYHYPSVLTELVELNVDADSLARSFTTDAGQTYRLTQGGVKTNKADTLIRCLCVYQPETEGAAASDGTSANARSAAVYQLEHIFSQPARPSSDFTSFPREPVQFISSWRSSRWLNLYLGVPTSPQMLHSYAFSQDSLVCDPSTGIRTAHLSFLHLRLGNTADAYTLKTYLSLPLAPFVGLADSLVLSLQTHAGERRISASLR